MNILSILKIKKGLNSGNNANHSSRDRTNLFLLKFLFLKTGFHYVALAGLNGTQYIAKTGFKLRDLEVLLFKC